MIVVLLTTIVSEVVIADAKRNAVLADLGADVPVIVIETDLTGPNPPGSAWWDVPVAEVSTLDSTRRARADYDRDRAAQRFHL